MQPDTEVRIRQIVNTQKKKAEKNAIYNLSLKVILRKKMGVRLGGSCPNSSNHEAEAGDSP